MIVSSKRKLYIHCLVHVMTVIISVMLKKCHYCKPKTNNNGVSTQLTAVIFSFAARTETYLYERTHGLPSAALH